jgi:zeaxanthin glucosyltransferase
MPTILFILLPFKSHYLATFGFANTWKNKGYNVVFTGNESLKETIEIEGFEYISFSHSVEYDIKSFKIFVGLFIKTLVDKNFTKNRFREFYKVKLNLDVLIDRISPEQIFIDEHISEYFFFLKSSQSKITILNTKLSTKKSNFNTPLNWKYIPNQNYVSKLICWFIWAFELSKLRFQEIKQYCAFCGKDESYFQKRLCNKNKLIWKDIVSKEHCFYRGIKNIDTVILAPEAFEFQTKPKQINESYFHVKSLRNEDNLKTKNYNELIECINLFKLNPTNKVIYCSLGTLSGTNLNKVFVLFQKHLQVSDEHPNFLLVVSSSEIQIGFFNHDRVKHYPFLPQLDFLKHTDLVICHGGLGTLKECYDEKIPMIIVPMNTKVDQIGNASRMAENNFGLVIDAIKDDSASIAKKISTIFSEFSIYL